MLGNRGQAAIEYLMTYGWTILIVIVVGVVMWQLGVLDVGQSATPGSSGFSQMRPYDWKASITGNEITLILLNDAGTRLTLNEVHAYECAPQSVGVDVLPADTYTVTLGTCGLTGRVGDYYRANVTVNYTNPASGIEHSSVGKVWGPLE